MLGLNYIDIKMEIMMVEKINQIMTQFLKI